MWPAVDIIRRPVRIRRSSAWRRALPAAGLLAVGAYVAFGVPSALVKSWTRAAAAPGAARDDAAAALARQRGPEYAAAIRILRERLPADGAYLLLTEQEGADMIVRFDLAPRRAVFGGAPKDIATNVTSARLPALPEWTVIASLVPPGPSLLKTRLLAEKGALP